MRRGNRINLSDSTTATIEAVKQAIEVQLSLPIRLINAQVDSGDIQKNPSHHIPSYRWRTVEIQGRFVTLTESGPAGYVHSAGAGFEAIVSIERDFSTDFWAPIGNKIPCALRIDEYHERGAREYTVRWAAVGNACTRLLREVELLDHATGAVIVGTDYRNSRAMPAF